MNPEVVVVGGGPAGAVTAGLLARKGVNVLLLDAARFPRDKPCGESLNPGAVSALVRLGLWESVAPLQPVLLLGWRLHVRGLSWALDFPHGLRAAAVDRRRLDQALLDWASAQGVRVEQQSRVTELILDDGRVTGVVVGRRHRILAPMVVGADGLRSVVVRRLGLLGGPRVAPKVALTAHWRGIEGLGERGELHFRGPQVCGIAPVGTGEANVTLVMPAGAVRAGGQIPSILRWPGLRERFAGAYPVGKVQGTGPFDQPVRALTASGAVLVGDAAGYFDPLTGQGIYRALRSAELAATAISDHFNGRENALPSYQRTLLDEIAPSLRLQRWIDALVGRPALLGAGLGLLGLCPPAGRWLVGLVGDCHRTMGRIPGSDG